MLGRARRDVSATSRKRRTAMVALMCLTTVPLVAVGAQAGTGSPAARTTWQQGTPVVAGLGVTESVASIMRRQRTQGLAGQPWVVPHLEPGIPDFRKSLPQNPDSPNVSQMPSRPGGPSAPTAPFTPQTLGTSFTGATISDTPGFVPPDTMGAVGPTQYVVTVNGRLRSFSKSTGLADGAIDVDPDVFFASVIVAGTSDPRVRYDRLSGRWFITMIDVASTDNRLLIAVSSGSTITNTSNFTFFDIPSDSTSPARTLTDFADYDTLGIDANALYMGINVFTGAGAFKATDGYVIRKSSVLGPGPIVVTVFRGLVPTSSTDGPYTPQGVDNYDPAATEGYFIGVSNTTFGRLVLRRVATPGGTPSISSNVLITVPTTSFPIDAPQTGTTKKLDTLDDRLFAAHIRNGKLWTAHNIQVNSSGVASATGGRDGTRWYELTGIPTSQTPSVVESGTIFDGAATNPRFFIIPSVMVSGQGHAALGFTTSGGAEHPNAATVGRLVGDTLGTVETTQLYTSTTAVYGPQAVQVQRWGDYSYTSLDPLDDMTMWTVQEFANSTNSWAVRVVKLIAPPPATPASASPPTVASGQSSVNVTITGTQVTGSGFYDPGSNLGGNAVNFSHIGASISGGVTVNSVTFTSPTSVTLNVSTVGATAGTKDVTITNPDGQSKTGTGILTVSGGGGPSVPPTVSVTDVDTLEGNAGTTTAAFQVTLSQNPAAAVSVNVATANSTASAGSDYVAVPTTTLTWNPGDPLTKTVNVTVNGDTLKEGNETYLLKLTSPSGVTIADTQGTGTIIDEEGRFFLYVSDASVVEGNAGTTTMTFNVSVSQLPAAGQTVTVKVATADGTASAPSDYTAVPLTTLSWTSASPSVTKTVSVTVNGDASVEPDETLLLKLSAQSKNAVISDTQGTGTILNDD